MEPQNENQIDSKSADNGLLPSVGDQSSEIEAYQQKIYDLSRLADLGQLSAGILHEIKNPVSFVNNFSRLSLGLLEEVEEIIAKPLEEINADDIADQKDILATLTQNLKKINENGKRIERIIQGMLSQARSDGPVFEQVNINQLLEEYSKLSYQSVRAEDREFNVTLDYAFDPTVGDISLARGEFGRVILNLVNNACYAVNEKRKQNPDNYDPNIRISTQKTDGKIEIKLRDNGIGIPAEIVSKLFDPFFTTKPQGKGTGLGLALTYSSVVDTHKGSIKVDSVYQEWTEFDIIIPA